MRHTAPLRKAHALLLGSSEQLDVDGRVVLVTGGGDGIGLAAARQLRARGALVSIVDRDEVTARTAVIELGEDVALAITADVTDRAALRDAVGETIAHFGRLDVVVANAGITPPPATIRSVDPAAFDRVVDVNLTGVLNTVQPAIEELIARRGHIVVVTSAAAFCPPVGGAAYMISKAAVEQLGRGLRLELAPHGVTVTVAYFGFVDTRLARATLDDDALGRDLQATLPAPLRKRITPDDAGRVIARAIRYRSAHSMAPVAWEPLNLLRGLVNPLLDRYLVADERTHEMILALEARTRTHAP